MHCPYLSHDDEQCKAGERLYNPSEFEMDEYCTTPLYLRCPLYLKQSLLEIKRFGQTPEHIHAHRRKKVPA